jgi:hypothetical protein
MADNVAQCAICGGPFPWLTLCLHMLRVTEALEAVTMQAQHRVMRGTWFVEKGPDWVPLRETIADELETAFRSEVTTAGRHRATWRSDLRQRGCNADR